MCCIHPGHSTAAHPAQTAAPARLQFTVSHCHNNNIIITIKCFPAHDELAMCRTSLVSPDNDSINVKQCCMTLHVLHFENVVGKPNFLALSSALLSRLTTKSTIQVVKVCTCRADVLPCLACSCMGISRAAQHSTAQHSTAQHSTAQHSTAQHSTAQHSTAHTACLTFWPWNWLIMRAPQP